MKVLEPDKQAEGRIVSKACGNSTVYSTRFNGAFGALDNRCPHQGGPLGEGSIENGLEKAIRGAVVNPGPALVEIMIDALLI